MTDAGMLSSVRHRGVYTEVHIAVMNVYNRLALRNKVF